MRQAMKEPEQSHPFKRPTKGDPFAIKLDRKNQTNEKKKRSALPGQPVVPLRRLCLIKFEQSDHSHGRRQNKRRWHQSHPVVRESMFKQLVNDPELKALRYCANSPSPSLLLLRRTKRKGHE